MKLDNRITESDKFLDMPFSAQCLYFHYAVVADNNGVVNNPKATRRSVGATYSDFQILEQNLFILQHNNKVYLMTDGRTIKEKK